MGRAREWARDAVRGAGPLVDVLYPPRCPLCGAAITEQGGLCAPCWSELEVPGEPACARCQVPLGRGGARAATCRTCAEHPPRHAGVHAATLYNEASRRLVLAYKHGGRIAHARLLARLMAGRLPSDPGQTRPPLLVPVPLHRWRLWSRGFNQAALLARELERLGKGELAVDALVRRRRTPSLGGLGREAREAALKGAISVRAGQAGRIAGRAVVLVDDVYTSGATAGACVAALLEAGAARVAIACFARVADGSVGSSREPGNAAPGAGQRNARGHQDPGRRVTI